MDLRRVCRLSDAVEFDQNVVAIKFAAAFSFFPFGDDDCPGFPMNF